MNRGATRARGVLSWILHSLREAGEVCLTLFRVMIPVIVAVKVLDMLGGVSVLADVLAPVMRTVGLPGEMGLVWASAMITNLYGGIAVFVSLAPGMGLSAAQVTVLCSMMLAAHSMPVELRVAQKAGVRVRFLAVFRLAAAYLLGMSLHLIYRALPVLEHPARILLDPDPRPTELGQWALSQLENLLTVFLIVLGLVVLMRVLEALGVTDLLGRMLRPLLESMGIGHSAATITVIGLVLGLSYGGGLIIREARSGRVGPRDLFFSVTLMGLAHALVEDTLLMLSLGAHLTGVLLGRVAVAWLLVSLLVRLVRRMPDSAFNRWLYRPRPES